MAVRSPSLSSRRANGKTGGMISMKYFRSFGLILPVLIALGQSNASATDYKFSGNVPQSCKFSGTNSFAVQIAVSVRSGSTRNTSVSLDGISAIGNSGNVVTSNSYTVVCNKTSTLTITVPQARSGANAYNYTLTLTPPSPGAATSVSSVANPGTGTATINATAGVTYTIGISAAAAGNGASILTYNATATIQ